MCKINFIKKGSAIFIYFAHLQTPTFVHASANSKTALVHMVINNLKVMQYRYLNIEKTKIGIRKPFIECERKLS